jgi:hypothetical protein
MNAAAFEKPIVACSVSTTSRSFQTCCTEVGSVQGGNNRHPKSPLPRAFQKEALTDGCHPHALKLSNFYQLRIECSLGELRPSENLLQTGKKQEGTSVQTG